MDASVTNDCSHHALLGIALAPLIPQLFPPQEVRGVDEPVKVYAFRSNNRAQ